MTTIASIGTGNMGTALIKGILDADPSIEVRATTHSAASAQRLAAALPAATVTSVEDDPDANRAAAESADFVFLGVKPWMMAETVRDLAPALTGQSVLVSMAAGVSAAAPPRPTASPPPPPPTPPTPPLPESTRPPLRLCAGCSRAQASSSPSTKPRSPP